MSAPIRARSAPPYCRDLHAWFRSEPRPWRWGCNGRKATITIAIGSNAWQLAKSWRSRRLMLVVPPGVSPTLFDWTACAGHDPILIAPCGEVHQGEIKNLVHALMRDGVHRVLELDSMDEYFSEGADHAA